NLLIVGGLALVSLGMFVFVLKAFPEVMPNHRVDTWTKRIDTFIGKEEVDQEGNIKKTKDDYQIERSKVAIARGGLTGVGVGKSVERNFLPQSSSDFIYAIIVEEMGVVGGFFVMVVYLLLL